MIIVSASPFQPSELLQQLEAQSDDSGAVVSFTGKMRETGEKGRALSHLYLEHYPAMTEASLAEIIKQAEARFSIESVLLYHRVGNIYKNDPIVFVGVISKHRKEGFSAAMMIMDYLKKQAPFWKKEVYVDGEEVWIAQKKSDQQSFSEWQ